MKRFTSVMAAALLGVAAMSTAHAESKQTIRLGWTTTDSESDPYAIGARAFKEALEAHEHGKGFDVRFFPNRQLGDEKALLEGVRMGMAEAALITNAVMAQTETAFLLNDLPFLYSSAEDAYTLMDGSVGEALAEKAEAKGLVVVGYMAGGFRNMLNNVRPVTTPDDVSGVKYRVMQSPIYIGMYESLGGSPVPMAWGETYTAIQQGALDGMELPLSVIDSTKSYEITKYLSLTQHTFSVIEFLFNKRMLDRLSDEKRQAILDAAQQATKVQRQAVEENSKKLVAALGEKGMEVNQIQDPAAFREKVKPVYEQFRSQIGDELLNSALTQVQ